MFVKQQLFVLAIKNEKHAFPFLAGAWKVNIEILIIKDQYVEWPSAGQDNLLQRILPTMDQPVWVIFSGGLDKNHDSLL